jgi:hypothetical protein
MAQQGRIVSREELMKLDGSSRETSLGSDIQHLIGSVFNAHFEINHDPNLLKPDIRIAEEDGEQSEEEVEFRLFSTGPGKVTKIKLDEPDFSKLPPGFVVPERPRSFYFQDTLPEKLKQQVHDSTVTGKQVMELSKTSWPGSAMPWKVLTIDRQGRRVAEMLKQHSRSEEDETSSKKARPGKKVRIARRKAKALKAEKAERAKVAADEKEAALRDKKTRRNREKKLKKKEKEKAKKSAVVAPAISALNDQTAS